MSKLNKKGNKQFDEGEFLDDTQLDIRNALDAIMMIEGGCNHSAMISCYQLLIDTGIIHTLQGSHQRTAQNLIDGGFCHQPS